MPSPPKPWERAGGGGSEASSSMTPATSTTSTATSATPALPDRPSSFSSNATNSNALTSSQYSSPYSTAGAGYGGLGSTYGGLGSSYGSYGSPYSRMGMGGMGGMGSMGGYGGYGGGYGSSYGGYGGYGGMGMGMGMGGMGGMGMGMGMGGMPGQPGDVSLTQRMESGTQATFELISSIVGAFGGFAQMLESTFMATHSSFFAMVGVADQFAHLRNYLGQVLSIFALARYLKNLVLRLTGRAPAIDLDPREFRDFAKNGAGVGPNGQAKARPSKRPLIVFFLAVVGLPYLMGKLVRMITAKQEAERLRLEQQGLLPPGSAQLPGQQQQQHGMPGMMTPQQQQQQQQEGLDPSKLTFVRALYAYNAADPLELNLKGNDIVAVLSKVDPSTGQESQWWKGRTRDGRVGWFPSTYVESLETAKERAGKLGGSSSDLKQVEAAPNKALPKPTASVSSTKS